MVAERRAREALTLSKVLDEALALIDAEGLERLSMRRLGARLGVEAMALYHHVANKGALLELLLERVVLAAGADVAENSADWRMQVGGFAAGYRAALLEHPTLVPLVAVRPIRSAAALQRLRVGAQALVASGFTPTQALQMLNVIAMFVIGHVLAEAGQAPVSIKEDSQRASAIATEFLGDADGPARSHQDIFEFGVAALLDGFAGLPS